jgi:hypothetical protein
MTDMSIDELEAAILKVSVEDRARLAGRLLESLDDLSVAENEQAWAEEAGRRNVDWGANPAESRKAMDVLRDAKARLR